MAAYTDDDVTDDRNDVYYIGTLTWNGTGTPAHDTTMWVRS